MKRLMTEYIRNYHDDRTHLGLEKESLAGRTKDANQWRSCRVLALPRLGGLHHRYRLAAWALWSLSSDRNDRSEHSALWRPTGGLSQNPASLHVSGLITSQLSIGHRSCL